MSCKFTLVFLMSKEGHITVLLMKKITTAKNSALKRGGCHIWTDIRQMSNECNDTRTSI